MADTKLHLSQEGLLQLQQELEYLKGEKRKEIADKLKEAISYGDLSENAEYAAAREEQAQIEWRIIELETMIKPGNYEIIDSKKTKRSGINMGAKVHVKNLENNEEITYTIVGSQEADIFNQKISNESPLGKELLWKNIKDIISVITPGGEVKYTIIWVE